MKAKALFIRLLTATALLCTLLSVSASARVYSGSAGNNIEWEFDLNTGSMVIDGSGDMQDYLNYASTPWSEYMLLIKNLTVSEGITSIGNCNFMHARFLESVILPSTLKSIGDSAFEYCTGLIDINFPNNITSFGSMCFASCSMLNEISIPDSTENIGSYAFSGTAITELNLSDCITSMGEGAFAYCSALTEVNIDCDTDILSEGIFYSCKKLEDVSFSDEEGTLGKRAFFGCDNLDITLPPNIKTESPDIFFGTGISFNVTWIVDGVKNEDKVKYGEVPEFSGNTKKNSALDGIYLFTGWSKPLEEIKANSENTYIANYKIASILDGLFAECQDGVLKAECNISLSQAADKTPYVLFSCYTESGEMIGCKRV